MSMTFTKLFSSITASTIWAARDQTRIVWITMLAMADQHGRVWASIPGLANIARVPIDACEMALDELMGPDKYSRTKDNEGRRVEQIDGGWRLLNHAKYRAIRDEESIKESKRRYINARRAVERSTVDGVEQSRTAVDRCRANTEAEAETTSSVAKATGGEPPADEAAEPKDPRRELYQAGKSLLHEQGMPKAQTGSFITKLAQDYGQEAALEAVRSAVSNRPLEAAAYLKATCQRLKGERRDPITVPSTDTGAEKFKAAMDERAATATRPPAAILALAGKAIERAA